MQTNLKTEDDQENKILLKSLTMSKRAERIDQILNNTKQFNKLANLERVIL